MNKYFEDMYEETEKDLKDKAKQGRYQGYFEDNMQTLSNDLDADFMNDEIEEDDNDDSKKNGFDWQLEEVGVK